jgi:ribonuclease P protein component
MLPKKNKLKKKKDFQRVFQKGRYYQGVFINLKLVKNNLDLNRIGIIIGVKVSKKAVIRNKIKRRIEESIRVNTNKIKKGFDIVVIVKPEAVGKSYSKIEENLISLFQESGLEKSE